MTILVGCSSWSYHDCLGRSHSIKIAKKKDPRFDYYAQFFRTVEINSTFYQPPGELPVSSLINKTRSKGLRVLSKFPSLSPIKLSWRDKAKGSSGHLL